MLLSACATKVQTTGGSFMEEETFSTFNKKDAFNVAVLLPLSGANATFGQGLKNATYMALEDVKNPNLMLHYYDTASSNSGARIAAENALAKNPDLVIGPLTSSSVMAVKPRITYKDVPMVAFSTSAEVLEPGVFTLGLMIEEQVDRILSYATDKGRKNFALLVPDNKNGVDVAKAAVDVLQKKNANLVAVAMYKPDTSDFSTILKQLTNYDIRNKRHQDLMDKVENALKVNPQDPQLIRAKTKLEQVDTIGGVDFDAVLIAESGVQLKSAIAMFAYYDVNAPKVKFLGTSMWENTLLNKETGVYGAWYPALSRSHSLYFSSKYNALFGTKPNALFALAYDAVALASALEQTDDKSKMLEEIARPSGYAGISGIFRLFPNGRNQHSLNVYEVQSESDVMVDAAPRSFANDDYFADLQRSETFMAPMIFGKENPQDAYFDIYGQIFNPENIYSRELSEEEEKELVNKEVAKMRIVIP